MRIDRRMAVTLVVVSFLAVFAVAFTLAVGQFPVPLGQIVPAILGYSNATNRLVINTLRLPRVLVALFVGASLGMSGAIFQGISGNPLVAPDIIGINSGAAVTVVVAIVVYHSGQPPQIFALGGAILVGVVVYVLSLRSGLSRFRMVLIGVGVNVALGAVITYLLTQANLDQVGEINQYLFGDVSASTWTTVRNLVPTAVGLMAIGSVLGTQLEILQLGDSVAAGLGVRVSRSRIGLLAVGVCLAAVAVAAAGPVGFVAFIAPHIARRLARGSGNGVMLVSAAVGAALVVIADYAAQRVLEPTQLPVGILTVLIGAPYFMFLLLRATRSFAV